EIEPDGETGGLYETGGRGWVVEPETDQVEEWLNDPGEWNELSVVAQGPRILVHVNGHESADIVDEESRRSGPLGLQLHGGMTMDVRFKDIEVLKKVE
ncbi:MAG: family 16 glycoside hydrolase, partial [Rhodothermales bacterium]